MRPLALLLLAVAAGGCVAPRYVPTARHTPLMQRAGEVQGRIDTGHGLGGAVFVSPLPHLTAFVETEGELLGPGNEDYRQRSRVLVGGGLGGYLREGPVTAEVLGGLSVGSVNVRNTRVVLFGNVEEHTERIAARETRAFAQANAGVTPAGSHVTLGTTLRVTRAHHDETRRALDGAPAPTRSYAATFVEPGVFMRVSLGDVTLEGSVATVQPLGHVPDRLTATPAEEEAGWLDYERTRVGLGVALPLDRLFGRSSR